MAKQKGGIKKETPAEQVAREIAEALKKCGLVESVKIQPASQRMNQPAPAGGDNIMVLDFTLKSPKKKK